MRRTPMSLDDNRHSHQQISRLIGRLDSDCEASDSSEDPDDLELREDLSDELQASLEAVDGDGATRSAEEVAQRLSLSW